MKIKELKKIIGHLPDDMDLLVRVFEDANYGTEVDERDYIVNDTVITNNKKNIIVLSHSNDEKKEVD